MIKRFLLIASILITIVLLSCAGKSSNYLIIPGDSVGKINAETTEKDLDNIFEKQAINTSELDIGEGETVLGSMIIDKANKCSIAVIWKDSQLRNKPKEVRFLGNKTQWKTSEGITLGTTLKQVEKINGGPFTLMGFDWDYQGTFMNSNQGKLSYLDRTGTIDYGNNGGKMLIRLQPAQPFDYKNKEEIYKTVLGDREYSSDLPAMQKINPVVTEMIIYFP